MARNGDRVGIMIVFMMVAGLVVALADNLDALATWRNVSSG